MVSAELFDVGFLWSWHYAGQDNMERECVTALSV